MCLWSTLIHLFLQYVFPKVSLANHSEIKDHSNHVHSLLTGETNHFLNDFLCIATFFLPILFFFFYKIAGPDQSRHINITFTSLHLRDAFQSKDTELNYPRFWKEKALRQDMAQQQREKTPRTLREAQRSYLLINGKYLLVGCPSWCKERKRRSKALGRSSLQETSSAVDKRWRRNAKPRRRGQTVAAAHPWHSLGHAQSKFLSFPTSQVPRNGGVSPKSCWELRSAELAGAKVKISQIFNATSAYKSSVVSLIDFCVLHCSLCVK